MGLFEAAGSERWRSTLCSPVFEGLLLVARDAHDREDLLRDAKGLRPRAMVATDLGCGPVELFVGFRGASLSLYFGQDWVVHFNDRGELRRAYIDPELIKAVEGQLTAMRRQRSERESDLVSRVLDAREQSALIVELETRLEALAQSLNTGRFQTIGEIPESSGLTERLQAWLANRPRPIAFAAAPNIG
jgi:hypothetical protein